jgi:hypothetical protein
MELNKYMEQNGMMPMPEDIRGELVARLGLAKDCESKFPKYITGYLLEDGTFVAEECGTITTDNLGNRYMNRPSEGN